MSEWHLGKSGQVRIGQVRTGQAEEEAGDKEVEELRSGHNEGWS